MVKNATGGKGGKKFARKQMFSSQPHTQLRLSESKEEMYAVVSKILGGGHCYVKTVEHEKILCYIPNKFSGRSKRNNLIVLNTVLLVGTREWETPAKTLDVLCVYDSNEVAMLIKNPKFPYTLLLSNKEGDDIMDDTLGLFSNQSNHFEPIETEGNAPLPAKEEWKEEDWENI